MRPCGRRSTESIRADVEVTDWNRRGLIRAGVTFPVSWPGLADVALQVLVGVKEFEFTFHLDDWSSPKKQVIPLTWTKVPQSWLGRVGRRPWFQCPKCRRRCEILYLLSATFACRECHKLVREGGPLQPYVRAALQAQKIRRRLGGDARLSAPFPPKPPKMLWKTYRRLKRREEEYRLTAMRKAPRAKRSKRWLDPSMRLPQ
jgi:hypothetical protein